MLQFAILTSLNQFYMQKTCNICWWDRKQFLTNWKLCFDNKFLLLAAASKLLWVAG